MADTSGSVGVRDSAIDFSELHAHHSRAKVHAFRLWARNTEAGSHHNRRALQAVTIVLVFGPVLGLMWSLYLFIIVLLVGVSLVGSAPWLSALGIGVVGTVLVGLASRRLTDIWRRDVQFNLGWRHWMRLKLFAESNGMAYLPEILAPAYPGTIFTLGKARRAYDVVTTASGRYVEIGNFQYVGDTAFDRSLNRYGYLRVRLDRSVPHLYLRSRRSRKFGAMFSRHQEFALEGDFGNYFRLYAPGGYERDALFILTPNLMAALIDNAADFDIEFVGREIYFYSRRKFRMRDPQTYLRSIQLVESIVITALKQTASYADFRTAGGQVGARGVRLSRGVRAAIILSVLLLVAQLSLHAYSIIRLFFR